MEAPAISYVISGPPNDSKNRDNFVGHVNDISAGYGACWLKAILLTTSQYISHTIASGGSRGLPWG